MAKPKVAVIIGAGFSTAVTSGSPGMLGHAPLPTLLGLGERLLEHVSSAEPTTPGGYPFSAAVVEEGRDALKSYFSRAAAQRYNFEEFVSLLSFRTNLFHTSLREALPDVPGSSPSVLRFVTYALYDLFASVLAYDRNPMANRNFFYRVNDSARARAMKEGLVRLVDQFDVSFVSFNYDGILEAFLDCDLGRQPPTFRYLPEISHGIPMVMPEHVYYRRDTRDLSGFADLPLILKPHGSIHFFQIREEIRSSFGGPTFLVLQPRLDLGFDASTMQRDVAQQASWRFTDLTPFVIPPVLNKDAYLEVDYFRSMLRMTFEAVSGADHILILGFSLPSSDLYVWATFEAVSWSSKRLSICYRGATGDRTLENWTRAAAKSDIRVLSDSGLPCDAPDAIASFWSRVYDGIFS